MAYIKDGGTGDESVMRLREIVLDGSEPAKGKKQKKEALAKDKTANLEPEITAVITKEIYEAADGNINKILNNTPEDLFSEEPSSETASLPEDEIEEEALKASSMPKRLGNTRKELRRKISSKKEEAAPEVEDEYKTQLLTDDEPQFMYSHPVLFNIKAAEKIEIDRPNFRIGIAPDNDYVINQDMKSHTVSRHHMTLSVKNDTEYITDESSNGTYVGTDAENPASFFKLPKGNAVELKDGQYIKIAGEMFQFLSRDSKDE